MFDWLQNAISSIRGSFAERAEAQRIETERRAAQEAEEIVKAQRSNGNESGKQRNSKIGSPRSKAAMRLGALSEVAAQETARQREIEGREEALRRWVNPFRVGERFENRKGAFTVISLSDDQLRLRWDTGEGDYRIQSHLKHASFAICSVRRSCPPQCIRIQEIVLYALGAGLTFIPTMQNNIEGKPYGSTCIRHERDERARHQ